MSSLPSATVPSFQACRHAARAVRSAQAGRQAMEMIRPRGVAVIRSRAPLALLIRFAALEGRLVWRGPDAFAVIEAPTGDRLPPGARRGTKLLRFADRYWDMMILGIPALLALILAAGLAFLPTTRIAALVATLFAVVWVTLVMTAIVVKGFTWLYRILIMGHPRNLAEQAIGQLCGLHWSIPLLHASRPSEVTEVLSAASKLIMELVRQAEDKQSDIALCLERGVTTKQAREGARAMTGLTPLPGHPVLVVARGRDRLLREPINPPGVPAGGIPLLLLAMAAVLSVGAQLVAEAERADCAPTSCMGRPASYGDALYWLLSHVLGGDSEGLAAGSLGARSIGLSTSVMGLIVIGWVITSALQRAIDRVTASGPELVRNYNTGITRDLSPQHPQNLPHASSRPAVTRTALASSFVVTAFFGYLIGRIRHRRSRRS